MSLIGNINIFIILIVKFSIILIKILGKLIILNIFTILGE